MKYLFIIIFTLVSFIHLYACGKQKNKLMNWTKCLILLSLLGWYLTSVNSPSTILIIAIIASCIGDFFLISDDLKMFVCGGASFITAQFLYITTYLRNISSKSINVLALIIISIIYLGFVLLDFKHLNGKLELSLLIPTCLYLAVNGAMNCIAFIQMLALPSLASVMIFLGAIGFFVSDVILFDLMFNKEYVFKTHFMVMLTYIFAQFMIITGLILL